jgi:3',5'-cyclic AMP phosphodiesterase CpdA
MTWRTPDGSAPEHPTYVIAHVSDTHLTAPGVRYNGVLDADAALGRAAAVVLAAQADGSRFDAVVLSGDLTDTGHPDAYRRLRAAVEPLAVPTIYATGNHDVRAEFHRSLLDRDDDGPVLQVHRVGGLRIIVLDSTIPGAGHGRLTGEHLAELSIELAEAAPDGSIVVLHHAPLPAPSPLLSYFALEPASRHALRRAVEGTDVRLILAGHHHLARSGMLGAVPVAVAGSTAIRTDPMGRPDHERTWASGAFNLVQVYPDTVVVSVIPVDGAPVVFDLDDRGCRAVVDAHPIPRG